MSRRGFVARGAAVAGAAALAGPAAAFGRRDAAADLIVHHGSVISADSSIPAATAVAVSGGLITAVGSDSEVLAHAGPDTELIDANGGTVMPGIHDGHAHPFSGGQLLTAPSLNYAILDIPQLLKRIRKLLAKSAGQEPDGWLNVSLWDASAMDVLPTRKDLDSLDTRRPILIYAIDGHIALVNSRALKLAGIDSKTKDPPGGEIVRDRRGRPTGILHDNAINLVYRLIPPPTVEDDADSLGAGYGVMAKMGITSCLHAAADETELAALAALADRGEMPLRPHVALLVEAEEARDPEAMLERVADLRSTYSRPGFEIDNLKMFFDGVIEYPTQTAALLQPYRVNEGTKKHPHWVQGKDRGPTYWSPKVSRRAITAADAAGWQVHVHAIGDRAVRTALDGFEAAVGGNGRTDNRHTITHLELVDPADFRRFAELGVLASMQMQWAERDSYTVDRLRPYIGSRRFRNVYPAGSLKKAGAMLCGGSDWPVDPLLPMRQVEMAVNRTADEVYAGYPKPLRRSEGITLPASVAMHTRNSAYQLHQETLSGRVRPGLAADLAVLDRDILGVPLAKVSNSEVRLTTVGGRITHRRDI
ncbi:MAG: amidohydrolase [Solirubrobacterales bacterium]